jgi:hypothetical protein
MVLMWTLGVSEHRIKYWVEGQHDRPKIFDGCALGVLGCAPYVQKNGFFEFSPQTHVVGTS